MTNSEEDEEEPVEQQEEEEEDDAGNQAQENLLRLLGQLQGEAVDGEGEGNLDDIFQRLMNHLQPKASTSSIDDSPMAKLNEEMFQAVRSGDINRFQACLAQGTFSCSILPSLHSQSLIFREYFLISVITGIFANICEQNMPHQQNTALFKLWPFFKTNLIFNSYGSYPMVSK